MKFIKKMALKFCGIINKLPFNNKIYRRGNKIIFGKSVLVKCRIDCKGKGNVIEFSQNSSFRNCNFLIYGNDNIIRIDDNVSGKNAEFYIEDNGGAIVVKEATHFCGKIHLACIEGCQIQIGKDCLFSSDIIFRTGDSHSLLDMDGNRINPSKNIKIGNHVWIGNHVIINKGVTIGDNNMIGTGAVVTKSILESNNVIAGVPAKIVKRNTNWCSKRL
ncbi:MAG: acyltransferase [Clostridiales bacterium]|nr:acyltransferase [Clostridiales bacterium]